MKNPKKPGLNEIPLSLSDFLKSFNQNMPTNFPQVREEDLLKFKKEHEPLFKILELIINCEGKGPRWVKLIKTDLIT